MAVMARWLTKKWEVSPKKIYALDGLSTSYRLITESAEDAEGSPPLLNRGMELQPLSFDTLLSESAGVRDVAKEIDSWKAMIGRSGPFRLGGSRFGPRKFILIGIEPSEMVIDDFGRIRQALLSMSFLEDAMEPAKRKAQAVAMAGASAVRQLAASALDIGAHADDKETMKPFEI